jgi:hypothetical protein
VSDTNRQLVKVNSEAPDKPAAKSPARRAPVLLEAVYSASMFVALVAGGLVLGLSLLAGVEVWWAGLRATLAVAVVGAVLWALNYHLMHATLAAAVQDARDRQTAITAARVEDATLGMEWKA